MGSEQQKENWVLLRNLLRDAVAFDHVFADAIPFWVGVAVPATTRQRTSRNRRDVVRVISGHVRTNGFIRAT
eukprot:3113389-Pleurochrysis_carterae.AAC.1